MPGKWKTNHAERIIPAFMTGTACVYTADELYNLIHSISRDMLLSFVLHAPFIDPPGVLD